MMSGYTYGLDDVHGSPAALITARALSAIDGESFHRDADDGVLVPLLTALLVLAMFRMLHDHGDAIIHARIVRRRRTRCAVRHSRPYGRGSKHALRH